MDFGFDDDQLAFRDAVRDLLDKECPPEAVRAAGEAAPLDRGVWDRLVDMGVPAILVREDQGGLGLDERSLALVLEEAGRAALPHPLVDTAAVAAPLLGADAGLVATDLGGPHVACAADADALLLHHEGALWLADPASVTLTPVATVDPARRAAVVEPGDLAALTATYRGERRQIGDAAAVAAAFDRGAWGTAAVLVGLGARMVELTVAYVTERHQFGVPVGSFQAVKHQLADAHKDLAFARPAVHRAAHSLATGAPTATRDVSMAKALASDAAWRAGRAALQCHGAIGYTVEHDLHLYLKRTWALAKAWGDAAWHRDRVATAIGI
jgi:alkylation response protein AidB-like acyl-CoA dehydrogenase